MIAVVFVCMSLHVFGCETEIVRTVAASEETSAVTSPVQIAPPRPDARLADRALTPPIEPAAQDSDAVSNVEAEEEEAHRAAVRNERGAEAEIGIASADSQDGAPELPISVAGAREPSTGSLGPTQVAGQTDNQQSWIEILAE
jgi:hypothetical protein